uniref:CAF1 n=1 Tax=Arundo donax TaxID=35708 RepID=A0A0A9E908_ARUDO
MRPQNCAREDVTYHQFVNLGKMVFMLTL